MGSKSTFLRGAIGGLEGRTLRSGDVLAIGQTRGKLYPGSYVPCNLQCRLPDDEKTEIRVMMGPQEDSLLPESLDSFLTGTYTVTGESDRMGYRLQGPTLSHHVKADIVSDGIAPGSIQVPGHGQPIVMLADRQSTGGYAKVATVIGADLPLLGQMKPGDKLHFVKVTRDVAVRALMEQRENLARLPYACGKTRYFKVKVGDEIFRAQAYEMSVER